MTTRKSEIEKLREEKRYAQECLAILERGHNEDYDKALEDMIPIEHRHFLQRFNESELSQHVKRLERDIEDLEEGWL